MRFGAFTPSTPNSAASLAIAAMPKGCWVCAKCTYQRPTCSGPTSTRSNRTSVVYCTRSAGVIECPSRRIVIAAAGTISMISSITVRAGRNGIPACMKNARTTASSSVAAKLRAPVMLIIVAVRISSVTMMTTSSHSRLCIRVRASSATRTPSKGPNDARNVVNPYRSGTLASSLSEASRAAEASSGAASVRKRPVDVSGFTEKYQSAMIAEMAISKRIGNTRFSVSGERVVMRCQVCCAVCRQVMDTSGTPTRTNTLTKISGATGSGR